MKLQVENGKVIVEWDDGKQTVIADELDQLCVCGHKKRYHQAQFTDPRVSCVIPLCACRTFTPKPPKPDWLDERDFYEVMQEYRHAPDLEAGLPNQAALAFEKVKRFIRGKVGE